ncbi:MAG: transporter substrate-binding domain-containing protein [Lachnospiraceae bacterium]|nr:transporter substrate-binding domain-containing protein [Lachnospiraceae bacterium]
MKKITLMLLITVLCAVALTACGGSKKENTVHSIDDLNGKKIGVQIGTTGDTLAGDIEGATVEKYNKYADAVQALKQGKIDAVIVDSDTANVFVSKNKDVELLSEGFADEEYAIAMHLDNTKLQEEINKALSDLKADGTLKKIKDYYDGDKSENADAKPYTKDESVSRNKGTLIMATNSEFPPYEYMESGRIVGFDVDMMNAVCDKLGYELKIEDMAFDSIIAAVQSGKADVGVAGMSVTPARQENVRFSDSYTVTHLVVMVRK